MNCELKKEICKNDEYFMQEFKTFNDMRYDKTYCDFTIISSDGEVFPIHKNVLAAVSPHFDTMFNVDMQEKLNNSVTFPEIDSKILRKIVDYLYTSEIVIDEEDVQLLLAAAHYLQINWIIEQCENFLLKILDCSNCVTMYRLAVYYLLKNLSEYCLFYMILHIEEFLLGESFLQMSYEEFNNLLTQDELYIHSQERFYNAVINWVIYKTEERKIHLVDLMSNIDLPLLGTDFLLRSILKEPLVNTDVQFKGLLLKGMQNQLCAEQFERKFSNILFIQNNVNNIYESFALPQWKSLSKQSIESEKVDSAVVFGKKLFYVLGGRINECISTDVEAFDPVTLKCSSKTNMPTGRYDFGACVLDNIIYACGGLQSAELELKWTEMYNMELDSWVIGKDMSFSGYTKSISLCNAIYCFGETSTCRLDPREGNWTTLSCAYSSLSEFGIAAIDEKCVYRIGLKNNDVYDIRNNKWKNLSASLFTHNTYGVINFGKNIYVIGDSCDNNSVEIYNTTKDEWYRHPFLKIECPYASAVALMNN